MLIIFKGDKTGGRVEVFCQETLGKVKQDGVDGWGRQQPCVLKPHSVLRGEEGGI